MASSKLERDFQRDLIKELKERFKGCIVLKNDPNYIQGIPDLVVFYGDKYAMLECKRSANARKRPEYNQEYWVERFGQMSYAAFIFPENKEEVLDELEQIFGTARSARLV